MAHQDRVKDLFDRVAIDFGEKGCGHFDYFGDQLVSHAELKGQEKILDVATGKAAVLRSISHRYPKCSLIGVDISENMLAEAKKRLPSSVLLRQMTAEHLDFENNTFDVVFCAFALYFFPDLSAALSEFKRVLKKGGRIAISSFGNPRSLTHWIQVRAKELGNAKSLRIHRLNTVDSIQTLLQENGFQNIQIHVESKINSFATPQAWWDSLYTHGVRAVLEQLSPDLLAKLREEAFQEARKINPSGPINIELEGLFATAQI